VVLPREPSPAAASPDARGTGEIVVFIIRRPARCAECDNELGRGDWLRVERDRALCLECADLGHLEWLPRGDAALTRRAKQRSTLHAVVVEWSRSRQRYERQGLLVEAAALQQAELECLADTEFRAHRRERDAVRRTLADDAFTRDFAAAVRAQYPACPADEAERIASHACQRASGRIGRTAAARSLDPEAVRLSVIAHVRHVHTNYDRLLNLNGERALARDMVRAEVEAVLHRWLGSDTLAADKPSRGARRSSRRACV
jgi:hypothetical protein